MVPDPSNRSKRSIFWLRAALLVIFLLLGVMVTARAASGTSLFFPLVQLNSRAIPSQFPDPSAYTWQLYASGLSSPTGMAVPGDGSGRLFIIEQAGRIRILQNGMVLATPFLDISGRVGSAGSEQGLLGLAFDPAYTSNGRFYVDYTNKNGNTVVSRFTRSNANPDLADSASEQILLTQVQPYANHNGGDLAFGPDGYLYIAFGDGGSAGDPQNNAQSLNTFLGKILRIDVSGSGAYTVPPANPFSGANQKREIWAYGLRNPWRFSFDRQTGDFYIADVGQDAWEEVDFQSAGSSGGQNYGWRYREGTHPYSGTPPIGLKLVNPVIEYSHSTGGCSIIGGYVYRGAALPEWDGVYFFGDFCSGQVWGLVNKSGQWIGQPLFSTNAAISSFGQDESGELYLIDRGGKVYKFAAK